MAGVVVLPSESDDEAESPPDFEEKAKSEYKQKMGKHFKKLKESVLTAVDGADFSSLPDWLKTRSTDQVNSLLKKYSRYFTNTVEERRKLRAALEFEYYTFEEQMKIVIQSKTRSPAIGIDLGTTYSCVGVCVNGEIEILENEVGQKTTPSYVAFDGFHTFIGQPAKDQAHMRPENTIFDAKRLIGRNFSDRHVQRDIELWPFEVVNVDSHPKIKIDDRLYYPEEISAEFLKQLKKQAEATLGKHVQDVVITVPAYFNNGQRQATKKAGDLAGFNVLRILNEPTAAAMTYSLHRVERSLRNVLIFDLGGGTFDVSVLTTQDGNIKIKAVNGDTHLGGEDFDNVLVNYCIEMFRDENDLDLSQCRSSNDDNERFQARRRLRRLRNECERQKKSLAAAQKVTVNLDAIMNGKDMQVVVTREKFEELIKGHINRCMEIVEAVIRDADLERRDIHDIVLVGGSSKIPYVQRRLSEYFPERTLNKRINPDEAVAKGAAILACTINEGENNQLNYIGQVSDVTPLSLGVTKKKSFFSCIIPKNTQIPCEQVRTYITRHDNQTSMKFPIFEGEDEIAENNHRLGELIMTNIPQAPAGLQKCDVLMKVDSDGIFTVQASMADNAENRKEIQISLHANRPRFEVEELVDVHAPPEEEF